MLLLQIVLPALNRGSQNDSDEDNSDDAAEPMETDEAENGSAKRRKAYDYSRLKRNHKAATGPREREQLDEQFRSDVESRTAMLARAAPNLKAVEQYDAVRVRSAL